MPLCKNECTAQDVRRPGQLRVTVDGSTPGASALRIPSRIKQIKLLLLSEPDADIGRYADLVDDLATRCKILRRRQA